MKVILLQDVKALGKKGDVVNVSDGYARNAIFPKKLGVEANAKNLNDLKLQNQHADKVAQENYEAALAMADYFTFPHNKTYTGSFSQHNHYEKVLKNRLKECIQQGEAHAYLEPAIRFADFSTLIDYIEATHEKYLNKLRSVEEDIRFILNMCFQVVQGLIQICIGNKNFAGAIQAA